MANIIRKGLIGFGMFIMFFLFLLLAIFEDAPWIFNIIWGLGTFLLLYAAIASVIQETEDYNKVKRIIDKGTCYIGTIIDYCDDWSNIVNGVPFVELAVKFTDDVTERILVFPAGTTKSQLFPIGSTIYVYKYCGEFAATMKYGEVPKKYLV